MTTTVHVVLRVNPHTGDTTRVIGVYTDAALARRVCLRHNSAILLSGPADREWSRP